MSVVMMEYPSYEVIKSYTDKEDGEMLINRILVAVTTDQEQKYAGLVDKGHLRFINWANPDRVDQE